MDVGRLTSLWRDYQWRIQLRVLATGRIWAFRPSIDSPSVQTAAWMTVNASYGPFKRAAVPSLAITSNRLFTRAPLDILFHGIVCTRHGMLYHTLFMHYLHMSEHIFLHFINKFKNHWKIQNYFIVHRIFTFCIEYFIQLNTIPFHTIPMKFSFP